MFNFRPDVPEGEVSPEDQFQQVFTWLVKFPDEDAFNAMQRGVTEAQYELKWGRGSWKKLKVRLAILRPPRARPFADFATVFPGRRAGVPEGQIGRAHV